MTAICKNRWVMGLPQWAADEVLYHCALTRVFRRKLPGGGSVICKELLGPNADIRFHHERGILERLSGIAGVPRLVQGAFPPSTIAMEDSGALPLHEVTPQRGGEMAALVRLFLQTAAVLADIHGAGVAHKNLNPDNVLFSRRDDSPVVIDFSLATTFAEERPVFVHHREIAGTLPYLAPEQTGRTGRTVDQRADLYGLGATFYHLLVGRPPFEGSDPLQLIHDILARPPVPPAQIVPSVPPPLSRIVMRLLEKEPDLRYQSAAGLKHDLSRLLQEVMSGGETSLSLGEHDFCIRLSPPSRLIGREREISALRKALAVALQGPGAAVLVSGAPGVGKSALVNELRLMVAQAHGWFVSGRFEAQRHDPASSANVQALRALGRLLLAEPEAELSFHRERLLRRLGPSAALLSASLPEFATILGVTPEQVSGDAVKTQARLHVAGLDLLCSIVSQRPVVVFLDDLQCAPQHAIDFIDSILASGLPPGLLLVGSHRDGEPASAPLASALKRWRGQESVTLRLRLGSLPHEDLALMIEEMLRLQGGEGASLAQAVATKTEGNPGDTVELLNSLRSDGILKLREQGWGWEDEAVRGYLTRTVVTEIPALRLAALPPRIRDLLRGLSCLGGEVMLPALAQTISLPVQELEEDLAAALTENVLVLEQNGAPGEARVGFRDDRVRQGVYRGIPPQDRTLLHLSAARRLSECASFRLLAAEQYLRSLELLDDPGEMRRVVALFREGAGSARAVANHQAAERFLGAALKLASAGLPEDPLVPLLEREWHAALYSLGRFEDAERLYQAIEEKAKEPGEFLEAACIQIKSLTDRGRPQEAVALGLDLLERMGVSLPHRLDESLQEALPAWCEFTAAFCARREMERVEVEDEKVLAVARLLHRLVLPTFFCAPAVSTWIVLECQRLWAQHGPCAPLISGFSGFPYVGMQLAGDYVSGARAAQQALLVGDARGYEPETSWVRHSFALFASHWMNPLEESGAQAEKARRGLLHAGEMQLAAFTYNTTLASFLDTAKLEDFGQELDAALSFALRNGIENSASSLQTYGRLLLTVQGGPESAGAFGDPSFDEAAHLAALQRNPKGVAMYHVHRALAAALFGDATALCRHAAAALPTLPFIQGMYPTALAHLLHSLSLACLLKRSEGRERDALLSQATEANRWLLLRAADAPENFQHLAHLVEAECAWAIGAREEGARLFDRALATAEEMERPWHRALITERAALFYDDCGRPALARRLLAEARDLYHSWGAAAKVLQLEKAHPSLRMARRERERRAGNGPFSVSSDSVDLLAILRASQALSSETNLERLKARVVQQLCALTGAGSVHLVVWSEDSARWLLLDTSGGASAPLPVDEAGAAGLLPLSAVRYVERTLKPLLVEDAPHDERFCSDPFLQGVDHCSLMLVPILNQGVRRAILILENRLTSGAFSCERLDAVQLMAGQLAVSLENALLYEKLEERVVERTRELQEAQSKLVATARQAGMAEVATNVLHNVGNVLNSVNVSAGLLTESLRDSKVGGLAKAVRLMESRADDLGAFFTLDDKGKRLPKYLAKLAESLEGEHREILAELSRLCGSIDHIKTIVATQQSYAGTCGVKEPVRLSELLEDALRMNAESFRRYDVTVVKEWEEGPELPLDRGRMLQILVNLISNANHAMAATEGARILTLGVELLDGRLRITVRDAGEGITSENLSRIFNHGFTTRKGGHGFGLHSCALAAKEMGGTLMAASDGLRKGACFTLDLPVETGSKG
ncbi:AAA family ATPase [Geomonas sp. RF6]|uniref:trifunctional serine/threonine-protein kinase/ATP-binding protein/sensor histidine kinase n=1 Tax=Geomonas sp. RF6 TaxID=2897342 RepID=UPI001E4C5171|nr:AAA family ATPase [Geomonas sp. RF6]UFS68943.1 AAA family ATPase [Geomonas sp. RF6]